MCVCVCALWWLGWSLGQRNVDTHKHVHRHNLSSIHPSQRRQRKYNQITVTRENCNLPHHIFWLRELPSFSACFSLLSHTFPLTPQLFQFSSPSLTLNLLSSQFSLNNNEINVIKKDNLFTSISSRILKISLKQDTFTSDAKLCDLIQLLNPV